MKLTSKIVSVCAVLYDAVGHPIRSGVAIMKDHTEMCLIHILAQLFQCLLPGYHGYQLTVFIYLKLALLTQLAAPH